MWFLYLILILFFIWVINFLAKQTQGQSQARMGSYQGVAGENWVNDEITRRLDPLHYHLIEHITLPTWDKRTTQIDHIIVSKFGVFVIETKTMKGWLFGSENSSKWKSVYFQSKYDFMNPLHQNYKHIKTLNELVKIPISNLHSIVVFVGDAEFKTSMPRNVLKIDQLIDYIRNYTKIIFSDEEIRRINFEIGANRLDQTYETDREHSDNLKSKYFISEKKFYWSATDSRIPFCPMCGKKMRLRTTGNNQNKFWGCSNYPKCKKIIEIV